MEIAADLIAEAVRQSIPEESAHLVLGFPVHTQPGISVETGADGVVLSGAQGVQHGDYLIPGSLRLLLQHGTRIPVHHGDQNTAQGQGKTQEAKNAGKKSDLSFSVFHVDSSFISDPFRAYS